MTCADVCLFSTKQTTLATDICLLYLTILLLSYMNEHLVSTWQILKTRLSKDVISLYTQGQYFYLMALVQICSH